MATDRLDGTDSADVSKNATLTVGDDRIVRIGMVEPFDGFDEVGGVSIRVIGMNWGVVVGSRRRCHDVHADASSREGVDRGQLARGGKRRAVER